MEPRHSSVVQSQNSPDELHLSQDSSNWNILVANRYSRRCFLIVKLGRCAQICKVLNLTICDYQFTTKRRVLVPK
ncbi:hypothetical protein GUJ93_ZPchr0003g17861 [Zizania palustris]|uniref:Uncharacterized protein n=1 Tax=Zizania palustris TaxID=103762 RepID=A0A8J5SK99_ZIZPA|nr:hypothetical protein GUJ93_ZPchr0003g17861 [Zizania palustris]